MSREEPAQNQREEPVTPEAAPDAALAKDWNAVCERLAQLEQRVRYLEGRLEAGIAVESPQPEVAAKTTEAGQPLDLEHRFASPFLNYLGLIALLVGIALLISHWMEAHSLAAILVAGASAGGLWGLGRWMRGRASETFSVTLEGTALGLLYLACYLSYAWWGIVPSLGAGAVVMLLAARRAFERNSQLVAAFALLAALVGTLLLRPVQTGESLLFGYLAAINGGAVWAGRRKGWIGLRFLALIGSHLVAWFWYWSHPAAQPMLTAAFPILTFLLFARIVPLGPLTSAETALGVMNSAGFLAASASLLRVYSPDLLSWSPLGLGIVHVILGTVWLFSVPLSAPLRSHARLHFWLGAVLIAIGLAFALPLPWIALGWVAEGLCLGGIGAMRMRSAARNAGGLVALGAAVAIVFSLHSPDGTQPRIWITAVTLAFAASIMVQHRLNRKYAVELGNWEWATNWMLAILAAILPMLALSQQVAASGSGRTFLTPSLATSLLWAGYSMGLCMAGWFGASAFLRWMGVALLLMTSVKVFLVDPVALSGISRIVSFLLLAVFLLLLSYLFQTRRR